MDGEIVENDDVARRQCRGELGFNPEIERGPIDRLVDHPRSGQLTASQACDERLSTPVAEGGIGVEPLTTRRAPVEPHHLGVDGCLVDEHQAMRLVLHPGLALLRPKTALSLDVGACAFRRHQRFFYK